MPFYDEYTPRPVEPPDWLPALKERAALLHRERNIGVHYLPGDDAVEFTAPLALDKVPDANQSKRTIDSVIGWLQKVGMTVAEGSSPENLLHSYKPGHFEVCDFGRGCLEMGFQLQKADTYGPNEAAGALDFFAAGLEVAGTAIEESDRRTYGRFYPFASLHVALAPASPEEELEMAMRTNDQIRSRSGPSIG